MQGTQQTAAHARYKTDSCTFSHMHARYTTDKAVPFVTWRYITDSCSFATCKVHNRQLHLLSQARYTTDSFTFVTCKVHDRQLHLCHMQCTGHNWQLQVLSHVRYTPVSCTFCHMQGTQQTAAPFVTCNVHNRQLNLLSHSRCTTDSCKISQIQSRLLRFLTCELYNILLGSLQGTRNTEPFRLRGTHRRVALFASVSKQQKAENLHLQGIQQTASTFLHMHYIALIEDICTICKRNKQLHFFKVQGSYS